MSVNNLSKDETRTLAKEIRKILEPVGSSNTSLTSEGEIRKHISLNYDSRAVQVDGMSDILGILESHYAPTTVKRLKNKFKKGAVWDTSVCCMDMDSLLELFYTNQEYVNIITSLTFEELERLAFSQRTCNPKAKVLLNCILRDVKSEYSITVPLKAKDSYVDTDLLDYCSANGYALYTYDKRLTLRARSRQISVFNIHKTFTSPYAYSPNPLGKDVVLDENLLTSGVPLRNIISDALSLGCRRFLITREFVETLEVEDDRDTIKKYLYFLLADENGEYTYYIPNNESIAEFAPLDETHCEHSILATLAEKYNAIVFTANPEKAFAYRSIYNTSFWYVASDEERVVIQKNKRNQIFPIFGISDPSDSVSSKSSKISDKSLEDSEITQYETNLLHYDKPEVSKTEAGITSKSDLDYTSSVSVISNPSDSSSKKNSVKGFDSNVPEVNRFVHVVSRNGNEIFCSIPRLNRKNHRISAKPQLNERMWVRDDSGKPVKLENEVKNHFTVIQCVNGLDGFYYLNVYFVTVRKQDLLGKLIYSHAFVKEQYSEVSTEYREYAEKSTLLT